MKAMKETKSTACASLAGGFLAATQFLPHTVGAWRGQIFHPGLGGSRVSSKVAPKGRLLENCRKFPGLWRIPREESESRVNRSRTRRQIAVPRFGVGEGLRLRVRVWRERLATLSSSIIILTSSPSTLPVRDHDATLTVCTHTMHRCHYRMPQTSTSTSQSTISIDA